MADFAAVMETRLQAFAVELERVHGAEISTYQREIDRLKAEMRDKEHSWLEERKRLLSEKERINSLYLRAVELAQKRTTKRPREETSVEAEPPMKRQRPAQVLDLAADPKVSPIKTSDSGDGDADEADEIEEDELNDTVEGKMPPSSTQMRPIESQEDDLMIIKKPMLTKAPSKAALDKADLFKEMSTPIRKSVLSNVQGADPARTPPLGSLKKALKPIEPLPTKPVSINLADEDEMGEKTQPKSLPELLQTPQQKYTKRLPLSKTPSNLALPKPPTPKPPAPAPVNITPADSDDQLLALAEAVLDPALSPAGFRYQEERQYGKERAKLPAHECAECQAFYNAYYEGDENNPERARRLQRCGRHRAMYAAPSTPPGYWDVDFNSQEDAKRKKVSSGKAFSKGAPALTEKSREDSF